MDINAFRDILLANGWKSVGKLRKKDGSSYEPFRKGNKYCWLGYRYLQHRDHGDCADYILDTELAISWIK